MIKWLVALPLTFVAIPGSAFAQAVAEQTAMQVAAVPFSPALGVPIKYRISKSSNFSQNDAVWDQELTYERAQEGYLVHIRTLRIMRFGKTFETGAVVPVTDYAEDMPLRPDEILALQQPVTLRLSPTGRIIAIDNWAALSLRLSEMPDELAGRAPAASRERFRETARAVALPIAALDAQAAIGFITREWSAMGTYYGARVPLGQKIERTGSMFPFGNDVPVAAVMDLSATRLASSGLSILTKTTMSKAGLEEAITRFENDNAKFADSSRGTAALTSQLSRYRGSDVTTSTQVELDERGVVQSGSYESRTDRDGAMVQFDRVDVHLQT